MPSTSPALAASTNSADVPFPVFWVAILDHYPVFVRLDPLLGTGLLGSLHALGVRRDRLIVGAIRTCHHPERLLRIDRLPEEDAATIGTGLREGAFLRMRHNRSYQVTSPFIPRRMSYVVVLPATRLCTSII